MEKKMTTRQIATQKKIIEAAKAVISEKGFEAASVDEIMAKADLGKGTFYTYFKRKEDVVHELNKTDFFRLAEFVNSMKDKNVLDKLEYYCREFMKSIERTGIEICRQWIKNNLSGITMSGIADKNGSEISIYQYDYQAMQAVLSEAVKCGQLAEDTPIDDLAMLINGQLYGLIIAWYVSDGVSIGSINIESFRTYMLEPSITKYIAEQNVRK